MICECDVNGAECLLIFLCVKCKKCGCSMFIFITCEFIYCKKNSCLNYIGASIEFCFKIFVSFVT